MFSLHLSILCFTLLIGYSIEMPPGRMCLPERVNFRKVWPCEHDKTAAEICRFHGEVVEFNITF